MLNPKSYKDITKKVSKDLELSEELVQDVVNFFYSRVRQNLTKLTSSSILLPGLGTFKLRVSKLQKHIKKNEDILQNLDPTKFEKYGAHKSVKEKLDRLIAIQKIVDQEKQQRQTFYEKRDGKTN